MFMPILMISIAISVKVAVSMLPIYLSVCLDANKITSYLELEKRHFDPLENYCLPPQNDTMLSIRTSCAPSPCLQKGKCWDSQHCLITLMHMKCLPPSLSNLGFGCETNTASASAHYVSFVGRRHVVA